MEKNGGTFRTVTLEKMKLVLLRRISEEMIDTLANPVDVDWAFEDWFTEDVTLRLKATVAGEHIETPAARYPKDWKEAVKERFFPRWALTRWPVRYTEKVFDARVVYPMVALPLERHYISVIDLKELAT